MSLRKRTRVGIVGAGPAGLVLSRMLSRMGIDSVVLESRSRDYIEQRIRAGVLEQGSVDLLNSIGIGERMMREGMGHEGIEIRCAGVGHRIDITGLTGRTIRVYGQQEIVKDLVAAHLAESRPLLFECLDVRLDQINTSAPQIHYRYGGEQHMLECEFIAGCDGYHGISRRSVPSGVIKSLEHAYPLGWLGILAEAAPSTNELIYAAHERGFALHSMRSPSLVRNYIQCAPDEDINQWSDARIWDELQQRMELHGGFRLNEGRIIEKSVTPMRSFVAEPMQYGRLYLAGDAAHIVPPTGAKGMNLALKDVQVLATALQNACQTGDTSGLDAYSGNCLRHVWKAQYFSYWMTSMLHRFEDENEFQRRLRMTRLESVLDSVSELTWLADNYAG